MGNALDVDLSEVEALAKKFEGAESVIHKKSKAFMHEAVLFFEGKTIDNTPVGATQELRNSIFSTVRGLGLGLEGIVASNALHAELVELGTKPHWPPIAPLEYWADRKLGKPGLGFVIARKIAQRGTRAQKMFETALEEGRPILASKVGDFPAEILKALR